MTISLTLADPDAHANRWNLIWWLSPVVFILWIVAGAQSFRRADEYQHRMQLESLAVRELRATRRWSQADLGDRLDVSR